MFQTGDDSTQDVAGLDAVLNQRADALLLHVLDKVLVPARAHNADAHRGGHFRRRHGHLKSFAVNRLLRHTKEMKWNEWKIQQYDENKKHQEEERS